MGGAPWNGGIPLLCEVPPCGILEKLGIVVWGVVAPSQAFEWLKKFHFEEYILLVHRCDDDVALVGVAYLKMGCWKSFFFL